MGFGKHLGKMLLLIFFGISGLALIIVGMMLFTISIMSQGVEIPTIFGREQVNFLIVMASGFALIVIAMYGKKFL